MESNEWRKFAGIFFLIPLLLGICFVLGLPLLISAAASIIVPLLITLFLYREKLPIGRGEETTDGYSIGKLIPTLIILAIGSGIGYAFWSGMITMPDKLPFEFMERMWSGDRPLETKKGCGATTFSNGFWEQYVDVPYIGWDVSHCTGVGDLTELKAVTITASGLVQIDSVGQPGIKYGPDGGPAPAAYSKDPTSSGFPVGGLYAKFQNRGNPNKGDFVFLGAESEIRIKNKKTAEVIKKGEIVKTIEMSGKTHLVIQPNCRNDICRGYFSVTLFVSK